MTRAKVRRSARPSVSVRPLAASNQLEVAVSCRHGTSRVGWRLSPDLNQRTAVTATIGHSAMMRPRCVPCLSGLWSRHRTEKAPADLATMAERFTSLWDGIERDQGEKGYALLDWGAAQRFVMGVGG